MEAWLAAQVARRGATLGELATGRTEPGQTALRRWAEVQFVRLCVANYSRILARMVADLQEVPCDHDMDAFNKRVVESVPAWNNVARGFLGLPRDPSRTKLPQIYTWQGAVRASLEAELTERVLRARAQREASAEGSWPSELPSQESATCPGMRWAYRVSPEGVLSIALEGTPVPGLEGRRPLRFSIPATRHPEKARKRSSP